MFSVMFTMKLGGAILIFVLVAIRLSSLACGTTLNRQINIESGSAKFLNKYSD
jgi:hypothetical protein